MIKLVNILREIQVTGPISRSEVFELWRNYSKEYYEKDLINFLKKKIGIDNLSPMDIEDWIWNKNTSNRDLYDFPKFMKQ